MAEQPQRPVFRDLQPLAAADLDLVVDNDRDRSARHARCLHTPGIAVGLRLTAEDVPMPSDGRTIVTKRLTLTAGVVNDGHGNEVVLAGDQPLPPEQFLDDIGESAEVDPAAATPDTSYPYPVLITAFDRSGPVDAFAAGECGSGTGPSRVVEDVQVSIGGRGQHLTLAAQPGLGPGEGLAGARPFRMLMGFVRFHVGLRRYVDVLDELDGVRPRRVGVRAAEVVTPADRLLLRVGDPAAAGQPALLLEAAGGGRMRFGRTTAGGGVEEVLSVSTRGEVVVRGTVDPGLVVGTVRVQSGVATDGMPLPLPPGVTPEDVDGGKVALHTHVTPRLPVAGSDEAFVVARCDVDEDRVAHCTLFRLETAGPAVSPVAVVACDFLVIAAVAQAADGSGTPGSGGGP